MYGNRYKEVPPELKNKMAWCSFCNGNLTTEINMITADSVGYECTVCDNLWNYPFNKIEEEYDT